MGWQLAYDATEAYDEMISPDGGSRPGCTDVVARIDELGKELFDRQQAAEASAPWG